MSDSRIKLEVDGIELEAEPGEMLISVTDAAGIYIPRFCYHKNLSIAANCRRCLVEVERAPKPLPACATPVMDGMKVFTRSERAISAQKATMEFLLINHPLDCPICDQGGECELQDLAMDFGRDISRFTERKRVVKDKNLGPLVSTDMTRCIHCTRCVRFGQEIAGIQELGTTGRGEWMEIGTYIEKSVDHELSGNIIDLCPVGALNNKPYRYRARAWEMEQRPTVAPHDCIGSNIFAHVLQGKVMRVVPRPNDAVNETWISDRDRFSFEGIYSEDRLTTPLIKVDGVWQAADWEHALEFAARGLKDVIGRYGAAQLGALSSASATVEESYLLNRMMRDLGSGNIDHRLRQQDFRDQQNDPVFPWLGQELSGLEQSDAILIVGSNLRKETPLLAHRVRKAAMAGGKVMLVNPDTFDYLFPVADYIVSATAAQVGDLAALVAAAAEHTKQSVPTQFEGLASKETATHKSIAGNLAEADDATILLGGLSMRHPAYADI